MNAPHESQFQPIAPVEARWVNRYAALGPKFSTRLDARPLPAPRWVEINHALAADLGWPADWWQSDTALACLSGGAPWPGMAPLATVYSGHQFGTWAGQLGDGRALLLGEVDTPQGPREIQLKGSGPTPYSRRGDGRAVLRSSIREYLCSEAMHALGIPTTRALALTASDLPVRREELETAAVVARVAPSFVRFGHFEHFCHHGQHTELAQLLDFVLQHHFPECLDAPVPAVAMLQTVAERTARLLAQWQAVGFCHGVMNTDNMSILGLTIDYGPFGFLDGFNPGHICNHTDHQGRYAYARQPSVAFWNLHALAQALVPLVPAAGENAEVLTDALEPYRHVYPAEMLRLMRAKLGLQAERDEDADLADDLLRLMAATQVDYTLCWRQLADLSSTEETQAGPVRDLFLNRAGFDAWATRYRSRLQAEGSVDTARRARMNAVNPRYVLRNHLAEVAIRQAQAGDDSEVQRLAAILARPFDDQPEHAAYAALPPDWAQTLEISCSS